MKYLYKYVSILILCSTTSLNTSAQSYCTPAPSTVDGDGIINVTMGAINNSTLAEPGNYGDYSFLVADVARSTTVNLYITYATGFDYETSIWIDWNQDFDFDDAGEEVYTGTSLANNPTTLTTSFTIPSTAILDTLRMRIGGADSGPLIPCYTGAWGAFEDYSINILPVPSCPPPYSIQVLNSTASSIDLDWIEAGNATTWEVEYGPTPFTVGNGTRMNTSVKPTTIGLTPHTSYGFYVRSICGSNDSSSWSGPFTYYLGYCIPQPKSVSGNGITNVSMGTINNATLLEPNNYGDYSTLVADVAQSTNVNVNITYSTGFSYETRIWVDWNNDLDFDDTGEEVYTGISSNNNPTTLSANFLVPSTAPLDTLRLRIGGIEFGTPTPCFNGWGGTYEDYSINVLPAPSCPPPHSMKVIGTTSNSIDLDWTELGTATNWELEYGPFNFTKGSGTNLITTTKPNNISLTPFMSYDFYIRSICGPNDTSNWAGPFTYYFGYCQPSPSSVDGDGITNVIMGSINNPTLAEPGNYGDYSFMVTDVAQSTYANVDITFSTGLDYETRIWVDWNNDYDFDDAGEEVYAGTSLANNPTTLSASFLVPSTATLDTLRMRIGGIDFGTPTPCYSGTWGTYEDYSINVTPTPSCLPPYNLSAVNVMHNTAELSWTELGTATTWEIEYDISGFTPGTGFRTMVNSNPATISGLINLSTYDYYVRAVCASNDSSTWSGPFTFVTLCNPFTAPYSEDFDNSGSIPNCWNQGANNNEDWLFSNSVGFDHIGNNGNITTTTPSGGYFAWVDDSYPDNLGTTIESPLIDVSNLTKPALQFYMISHNEGFTNVDFTIDVWDGAAWNIGEFVSDTNTLNGEWEEILVFLDHLNITGPIQLRFNVDETNGTDFYDDIAIDDVSIIEAPTCLKPTLLSASSITDSSAMLNWTEHNSATEWYIEYGIVGFTPGTGTKDTINTNPSYIQGLSPTTTYEFYVLSVCGRNDYSSWSGPFSFTTIMAPCTGNPDPVISSGPSNVCAGLDFVLTASGATQATGISYEWQVYDSTSSSWISTNLTKEIDTVIGGIYTPTSYRFITSCSYTGLSDTSNIITIGINPPTQCYCTPIYSTGCTFDDDINSLTLNGAFNTSINDLNTGCSPNAYDDKTSLPPIVMEVDSTYNGTINSTYTFPSQYANIWIDFDDDGFFDPSDLVESVGPFADIAVPFSITIPTGADTGMHRMRIRDVYNGTTFTFDACSSESYGETHDYMVYIGTVAACNGTPNQTTLNGPSSICAGIPFNITASGMSISSGISFQWEESPAGMNTWSAIAGYTSPNASFPSGITIDTDYRFISSCAFSGVADTSSVHSISITPPGQCYCTPIYSSGCNFGDDINTFTVSGVNGTSINDQNTGCSNNSYDDRTQLPVVELIAGLPSNASINANFSDQYAKVWIDFGDDGVFADSSDLVGIVGPFGNANTPFLINVPGSADSGLHRMRVRSVYFSTGFAFDACTSQSYGEVHDYMTHVHIPSCPLPSNLNINNISLNSADLAWIENGTSTEWQIEYGATGFAIGTGLNSVTNLNPHNITGLNPGTSYEFYVRSICGRADTSYWAGPFKFLTSSTIPFFEDFENFGINTVGINNVEGWSGTSTVLPQWHSDVSTPSIGTGPVADHTLGNSNGTFVYLESSGGIQGDFDELISPPIYVDSSYNTIHLSFWHHMHGVDMGDLEVYVLANGVSTLLTSITGEQHPNQTDPWTLSSAVLTGYQDQSIQIVFKGIRGNDYTSDMAIDDVMLHTNPVGVDETIDNKFNIQIYPNPTKGIINLIGNASESIEASVFNSTGKLIYKMEDKLSNNFNKQINLTGWAKGVYFVKLQSTNTVEIKKVVIQ